MYISLMSAELRSSYMYIISYKSSNHFRNKQICIHGSTVDTTYKTIMHLKF